MATTPATGDAFLSSAPPPASTDAGAGPAILFDDVRGTPLPTYSEDAADRPTDGIVGTRSAPLRLMAVHAHPDDESSKGGATMARYVREGAEVLVCTMTGGERGDILNVAMDRPEIRADLPAIRRAEMARASEIIGLRHQFLGFIDSGLPEGDSQPPLPEGCFARQPVVQAAELLVAAVRTFRPHVMLTYEEGGDYPHPDHVHTHLVSVEAFGAAADPDRYRGTGEPWQPLKLYYFASFHRAQSQALQDELLRRGLESPYLEWLEQELDAQPDDSPELEITTRIPCADYFDIRDQALRAHATQIDPGDWFTYPLEVEQSAWPTEDYHLASSLVDTQLPEDDLFAGIREESEFDATGRGTAGSCSEHG
jgi:mycothiol S-conjugate amidase